MNRYKRIEYNLDIMRQTVRLIVNPIMVDSYAFLFNCTAAVLASDSMMTSSYSFHKWVGAWCYVFSLARRGSTSGFLKLWLAVFERLTKSIVLFFHHDSD